MEKNVMSVATDCRLYVRAEPGCVIMLVHCLSHCVALFDCVKLFMVCTCKPVFFFYMCLLA